MKTTNLKKSPRRRFGRPAGRPRSRFVTLGIGVAVIVVFLVQFAIGYKAPDSIPGRSYYTITAKLHNADNLEDHDQVRIGGLLAGQILGLHVADHLAVMQLQLASNFGPLHSTSRMEIRLRSAVGTRFLQIDPGVGGVAIPAGGTLDATHTRSPVDLDQVLDVFNKPTQVGFQRMFGQLGAGLAGRGAQVNQLIGQAPPFLSSLGSVSQAIASRPGAMGGFIIGAREMADAFNPVRYVLAAGFDPSRRALEPFISQRPAVEATLDQAPPTLQEASSGLPQVNALLVQVDGLAHAAVPTLDAAPGALGRTSSLLRVAQPGLRQANATLTFLSRAVHPTVAFLRTAQGELPRLNSAFVNLKPITDYIAPRSCGLSDAFTGWSEMMKLGSDSENYIRFTVTKDPTIVSGYGPELTSPYPGPCSEGDNVGGPYGTPETQYRNVYHEPVYP